MNRTLYALGLAVTLFLASCGGGGGGGGGSSGGGALTNLSYPIPSAIYLVGVPITPNTPSIQGTVATWTIAPALPAGLLFNAANGKVNGTPSAASPARDYTVTASNSNGSLTFGLRLGVERPPHFVLVTDEADGSVSLLTIEAATGGMHHQSFAKLFPPTTEARDLAISGVHSWVLVSDAGFGFIAQALIEAGTGRITLGTVDAAGSSPTHLRVRSDGKFAYVLDPATLKVLGFSIDATTGDMTADASNTVAVGADPLDLALDPQGAFAFVCTSSEKKITSHGIGPANGMLTAKLGELVLAGAPTVVAVSPDGEHLCALLPDVKQVAYIDLDRATGALTLVNTRVTGALTKSVAFHPCGRAVYLTSKGGNRLSVFPIDETPAQLGATLGSFETSDGPETVSFDPAGLYAFVAAEWANKIDVYTIAQKDLRPTRLTSVAGRGSPRHFANLQGDLPLAKESPFLYTLNPEGDSISPFSIANTDGSLSAIGSDVLSGNDPSDIILDVFNRFLFVASRTSNEILTFSIDPGTGALSAPTKLLLPNGLREPVALGQDPSGLYLYIAADNLLGDGTKNFLVVYGVNQDTGALEGLSGGLPEIGALGTANPISLAIDPTGRFLYVSTDDGLRMYAPQAGVLGSAVPFPDPIASIANYVFAPSGSRVWVTLPATKQIRCFNVDSLTGAWTFASSAFPGSGPWGLAALRGTDLLFATLPGELPGDGSPDPIVSYRITPEDGALEQIQSTSLGLDARNIASDASGRFLYVVNEGGDDIDVLLPNRVDGTFEVIDTTTTGLGPFDLVLPTVLH